MNITSCAMASAEDGTSIYIVAVHQAREAWVYFIEDIRSLDDAAFATFLENMQPLEKVPLIKQPMHSDFYNYTVSVFDIVTNKTNVTQTPTPHEETVNSITVARTILGWDHYTMLASIDRRRVMYGNDPICQPGHACKDPRMPTVEAGFDYAQPYNVITDARIQIFEQGNCAAKHFYSVDGISILGCREMCNFLEQCKMANWHSGGTCDLSSNIDI
jgi:hypothetical protein